MKRIIFIAFSILSFAYGEELMDGRIVPPDRDIIAAYPLSVPIESIASVSPKQTQIRPFGTTLIPSDAELHHIVLSAERFTRFPVEDKSWLYYDKTNHRIIAKTSPIYHHAIGEVLKSDRVPVVLKLECAIYELPTKQALSLTREPFPKLQPLPEAQTQLAQLALLTRPGAPAIGATQTTATNTSIEWDPTSSNHFLEIDCHLRLTHTSAGRTRKLIVSFYAEPTAPVIFALGPSVTFPDHTIVAIIKQTPVSSDDRPMINGRICQDPSDFLTMAFGIDPYSPSLIDPSGVGIFHFRVPPDFIPDESVEGTKHTLLTPAQTQGLIHGDSKMIDASGYLRSRGVPFKEGDWVAFDRSNGLLHARFQEKIGIEIIEALTYSPRYRHGHCGGPLARISLLTHSRTYSAKPQLKEIHGFYSIACRAGSPYRITISEAEDESEPTTMMEIDPTLSSNHHFLDLNLTASTPLNPKTQSQFNIGPSRLTLQTDAPLMIDTGLDNPDGSTEWIELRATTGHAELPLPK